MSTIFKAQDLRHPGAVVAVKVPLPQFSNGLGAWSMFQREAEIGGALDHPSILRFVALPPDKHRNYVVTECVEGKTLATRVGKGKAIAEPEALSKPTLENAIQAFKDLGYVEAVGEKKLRLAEAVRAEPARLKELGEQIRRFL